MLFPRGFTPGLGIEAFQAKKCKTLYTYFNNGTTIQVILLRSFNWSYVWIYIIYSKSVDKYYIGNSNDSERRPEEHNTKPFNTYTSKHRSWTIKAAFPFSSEDRGQVMKIERYLKKLKKYNPL
ncbi:MAG: GIY-YIG nuclease family protein [Bacteroidales bacterium]|nr:GIY-YIG nuclease family protein [Bacteroidales bacterium]